MFVFLHNKLQISTNVLADPVEMERHVMTSLTSTHAIVRQGGLEHTVKMVCILF